MSESIANNKRIAKNTLILYVKLIISIIINFVSARLLLKELGADDYGLYNVVGGIVSCLNILGTAMVATSYRYMAVEIGKGSNGNPNRVYNTVMVVHLIIALLLLILGETLGLYYVDNVLNVALERLNDARYLLHLSLITTMLSVVAIPANGLIIARERFLFTSVISIVSDVLKIVVICLLYFVDNKLLYYAALIALVHAISPIALQVYCRIKDQEIIKWKFNFNWVDYKSVLSFAWWIFVGAFSSIAKTQGVAMIINAFFGTILNAAYGLATQVYNATAQFTTTLRQAFVPQIMKGHASGEEENSLKLVYAISRYSFLTMMIISVPLIVCIKGVLKIWLGDYPEFTEQFIVFMLINGMINNLNAGFDATIQATGKIRKNQIGFTLIGLSSLPIIYVLYRLDFPPYINTVVLCVLTSVTIVFQCWIMKQISSFKTSHYIKHTLLRSLLSVMIALIPLLPFVAVFNSSTLLIIVGAVVSVIWSFVTVYLVGLETRERMLINNIVNDKIINKIFKR